MLPLGNEKVELVNLDIPYVSLVFLLAFLLEHHVDEKNMLNIEEKASIKISLDPPPKKLRPQKTF